MKTLTFFAATLMMISGCTGTKSVRLTVDNPSDIARDGEMVEIPVVDMEKALGEGYYYVTDASGNIVPSQITYDSMLIFQASVPAATKAQYDIMVADTAMTYETVTTGRVYPERADDVAWENDLVGFRAYGPATQAKGERAFGYDIFFKYHTFGPVLEEMYRVETDPATWRKADSLRAIDNQLAEDFINSISYHVDHGKGMDCYAVGPTLGAGAPAIMRNDTIHFPWCYETVEILDNGPLRFTARLDFAPVKIGTDSAVTEHRIITLDAGSHFNRSKVWYEGLGEGASVAVGFPRRDDSRAETDSWLGFIAYADPTQGPDNGKALLGIMLDEGVDSIAERDGHILGYVKYTPGDTIGYNWGFAWDRTDIPDMDRWASHIKARRGSAPLNIYF